MPKSPTKMTTKGTVVEAALKAKRTNRNAFAIANSIPVKTMYRIANGTGCDDHRLIAKVARGLGLDPADILTLDGLAEFSRRCANYRAAQPSIVEALESHLRDHYGQTCLLSRAKDTFRELTKYTKRLSDAKLYDDTYPVLQPPDFVRKGLERIQGSIGLSGAFAPNPDDKRKVREIRVCVGYDHPAAVAPLLRLHDRAIQTGYEARDRLQFDTLIVQAVANGADKLSYLERQDSTCHFAAFGVANTMAVSRLDTRGSSVVQKSHIARFRLVLPLHTNHIFVICRKGATVKKVLMNSVNLGVGNFFNAVCGLKEKPVQIDEPLESLAIHLENGAALAACHPWANYILSRNHDLDVEEDYEESMTAGLYLNTALVGDGEDQISEGFVLHFLFEFIREYSFCAGSPMATSDAIMASEAVFSGFARNLSAQAHVLIA